MGEGTGEEKIRREDGDGKVRLGECQADHKKSRPEASENVSGRLSVCFKGRGYLG